MEVPLLSPSEAISSEEIAALAALGRACILLNAECAVARAGYEHARAAINVVYDFGNDSWDTYRATAETVLAEASAHSDRLLALHARLAAAYAYRVAMTLQRLMRGKRRPSDVEVVQWSQDPAEPPLVELLRFLNLSELDEDDNVSVGFRVEVLQAVQSLLPAPEDYKGGDDLFSLKLSNLVTAPGIEEAIGLLAAYGEDRHFGIQRHLRGETC